ncbi:hypothetical protein KFL_016210010, partial [Klebsormidium nitens]
ARKLEDDARRERDRRALRLAETKVRTLEGVVKGARIQAAKQSAQAALTAAREALAAIRQRIEAAERIWTNRGSQVAEEERRKTDARWAPPAMKGLQSRMSEAIRSGAPGSARPAGKAASRTGPLEADVQRVVNEFAPNARRTGRNVPPQDEGGAGDKRERESAPKESARNRGVNDAREQENRRKNREREEVLKLRADAKKERLARREEKPTSQPAMPTWIDKLKRLVEGAKREGIARRRLKGDENLDAFLIANDRNIPLTAPIIKQLLLKYHPDKASPMGLNRNRRKVVTQLLIERLKSPDTKESMAPPHDPAPQRAPSPRPTPQRPYQYQADAETENQDARSYWGWGSFWGSPRRNDPGFDPRRGAAPRRGPPQNSGYKQDIPNDFEQRRSRWAFS